MNNFLVESFYEFTKAIPDGALLVSKDGEIIAANPTAIRLLDPFSKKTERLWLKDIVTESEDKVLNYLKICSRNSEQIPGSFTIKSKNRQLIECRFKGSRIHYDKDFTSYYILLYFDPKSSLSNKFMALNRTLEELRASNYKLIIKTEQLSKEIAERKKIEKELYQREFQFRELANQFNALLDANPDNLSLQSPDLRIVWANKAFAMRLGKNMSDIVGKHCYTLWHNKTEPCDPCPVQTSFRTGEPATQIGTTSDGRIFELRTIPIKEGDRVVNVVEVGRDITEQRKLEDLYLHSQKMESIGTFAAGIAHDFNNILTGILGYAEVALMTMKDDALLYKNLEAIFKAAEKAANLTKQLLAFGRQKNTNKKPVDLNTIVGNLEKLLKRIIPENIEVITFLCDQPLVMNADDTQIEQVLLNLATNARDAMPKGGKLSIITEKFIMKDDFIKAHGFGREGDYALISFSDTGVGMDEETKRRIFDPFFTTKEVGRGTGLGLSVVYGIIKNHDGYISVYTEAGRGTTFKIYLPLIEAEIEKEEKSVEPEKLEGSGTILLAEDEEYVREFISHLLKQYGYTVIETKDGEEAISKFLEYKDSIDLLLFDVMMPKKTGKDALDEIRKISPEVKVLFMSGYTRCSIEEQIALDGNAEILPKPIRSTSLLKAIRNKIDKM
jgi:signal transduction histidine kinase/ActR/RegA family two-component response regulator